MGDGDTGKGRRYRKSLTTWREKAKTDKTARGSQQPLEWRLTGTQQEDGQSQKKREACRRLAY